MSGPVSMPPSFQLTPAALAEALGRLDACNLEARSGEVATVLRALANDRRLAILCRLVEGGEMSVGAIADAVGLSQSAASQHLSKMRDEGIVAFRRESQTLHYRIADPRIATLMAVLHHLYCRV